MDIDAIFMTVALMVLANGAVLARVQSDLPRELQPAVRRWQVATALVSMGSGLFAIGSSLPISTLLTVANGTLVGGLTFYHWALRRFYGAQSSAWDAVLSVVLVASVFWLSAIAPHFTLRLGIVSALWIVILIRTLWTLYRHRDADPSRSRQILQFIYLVVIGFVAVRTLYYVYEQFPLIFTIASSDIVINLVSPIIMALLPVVGTTAFILMCTDRVQRQFQIAATTDSLTGLANRRTLGTRGTSMLERAAGGGGRFAVVALDIDNFKMVNDVHGHAMGDKALVHVAMMLRDNVRTGDVVVRSGGEEFVLLLDSADETEAVAVAERIRIAISTHPLESDGIKVPVTISAGVAVCHLDDSQFDTLLQRADRALYAAKMEGRNRIKIAA